MKTYKNKILTSFLVVLLSMNVKAQSILSLEISPSNPSTTDTIKVISYTSFGSSPSNFESSSVVFDNDTIIISASHSCGMLSMPATSRDTFSIGQLSEGFYELRYHVACSDTPTFYGGDTINFNVQQATSSQTLNNLDDGFLVYPNPATNEIKIDLKTNSKSRYEINFYSMLGQKVKTINQKNEKITIDISDLTDGVYFIVISDENNINWSQKIVKSNR